MTTVISQSEDPKSKRKHGVQVSPQITQEILRALQELRFGSVEIIIHDAQIVQIERKEKFRFQQV